MSALSHSAPPGDAPQVAAELVRLSQESRRLRRENQRLQRAQQRQRERQSLLDQISGHLHRSRRTEELIPLLFDEVRGAIGAEAQSVWLIDREANDLVCRFATGPGAEQVKRVRVPRGAGIVGATVERQEAVLVADAQKDPRHHRGADRETGRATHSMMSVPLTLGQNPVGAMQAINKRGGARFHQDDLTLFRGIADIAALAIENARLFAELTESYDRTLEALASALDLRDHETEGHSRRVVEYTARLAWQMGLPAERIERIRRGALLHDIGKIAVPDAILHKPGSLNDAEREVMQRHPAYGVEMLRGIPHLGEELRLVFAHQERWDGGGYPLGLRGEAIPLEARLFALADTLDAITSDRPYRRGRSFDAARALIAAEAGTQFDPAAVAAFLSVPAEDWAALRRQAEEAEAQRSAPGLPLEIAALLGDAYLDAERAGDQTGSAFLPFPPVRLTGEALAPGSTLQISPPAA